MRLNKPEPGYSWLCRNRFERERFLDIDRRMMRTNMWLMVLLLVLTLPTLAEASGTAIVILVATISFFLVVRAIYQRFSQPEVALAVALMVLEVGLAAVIVVDGLQHTGALTLMFWPAAGFSARYPPRVAAAATAFVALLIVAAEVGFGGSIVMDEPVRLTALIGGLIAVTAITGAARGADLDYRHESAHDPLTRMFNRGALESRVHEIEYQSSLNPEPVAVIVGDVDRFKSVNDTHGHATGDTVLRELAYIIRSQLRAFDPAYRVGGEEFVTLLLGERAGDAVALAERIRIAVCAQPIAGLPITISFGVAASGDREPFDWNDAFQSADRALYEAKSAGRNRVCSDKDRGASAAEHERRRSREQPHPQTATAGPRARPLLRRP
jgi:diguanylate cyclase (GGDEF)-like protein